MLNIFSNAGFTNYSQHLPCFQPVIGEVISEEFFLGYVPQNENQELSPLPGRITIDPSTITSPTIQKFLNGNTIEISDNRKQIDALVDTITQAKLTPATAQAVDTPYQVMAAFLNGQLSVWDTAHILLLHRIALDNPEAQLKLAALLDSEGQWTPEARQHSKFFTKNTCRMRSVVEQVPEADTLEKMRRELLKLPKFQQTFYWLQGPTTARICTGKDGLAIEANRVFLETVTRHSVATEPRLGIFTKQDMIDAFRETRTRLWHFPYPGTKTEDLLDGYPTTASDFSRHDEGHWGSLHTYGPMIVDSMTELLGSFVDLLHPTDVPRDAWFIADFDYGYRFDREVFTNPNAELQTLLEPHPFFGNVLAIGSEGDFTAWGWHMALQMHNQRDRWKEQYGLNIDEVPALQPLIQQIQRVAQYLSGRSHMESLYLLQKLTSARLTSEEAIGAFFESQPAKLPSLSVRRVVKTNDPTPDVMMRPNDQNPFLKGSWIVAEGEPLPSSFA